MTRKIFCSAMLLCAWALLAACSKDGGSHSDQATANPAPHGTTVSSDPTPSPISVAPTPVSSQEPTAPPSLAHRAAPWSSVDNGNDWTDETMDVMRDHFDAFEKAQDVNDFCPGYQDAARAQREICWLRLVGGVVKFESDFDPTEGFQEPNGGNMSIGLFSLSPGECDSAPTAADLKDPLKNLHCGLIKMAGLIARDGYIDGPASGRGAAAYWSSLRDPYTQSGYQLGKKDQVIDITSVYRDFK